MNSLEDKLLESPHLCKQSVDLFLTGWTKSIGVKPGEALVDFNTQATKLYFIADGCVRLFVVDDRGEEINIGFGYSNTCITSFQSFIDGKPSLLRLEAILESTVIGITKKSLTTLIRESQEIDRWYQSMLEATLSGHIRRQVELLTLKPDERYKVFLKRSGHLINAIPLKLIASYLMMTPETLSRIRAKIS